MMPRPCAAASAFATAIAIRSTSPRRMPCRGISASRLWPRHVLHHDEVIALGRFDFVNGDDVWMIERRGGLRLLHEPAAAILVGQAVGGQHLDRHLAAQPSIARAIHLAHAPAPIRASTSYEPSRSPAWRVKEGTAPAPGVYACRNRRAPCFGARLQTHRWLLPTAPLSPPPRRCHRGQPDQEPQ